MQDDSHIHETEASFFKKGEGFHHLITAAFLKGLFTPLPTDTPVSLAISFSNISIFYLILVSEA